MSDAKQERMIALRDALAMAAEARGMVSTPIWSKMWDRMEGEFLERLLKCGPTEDAERYRLSIAIEVTRKARATIEHASKTESALERELDLIEGRKLAPVA